MVDASKVVADVASMSNRHVAPFATACTSSTCLERRVVDSAVEFRSSDPSSDGTIGAVPASTWESFLAGAEDGSIVHALHAFRTCDIDAFLKIRARGSGVTLTDARQNTVVLTGEEWGSFLENPLGWSVDKSTSPVGVG
jgi:hypothetical protein